MKAIAIVLAVTGLAGVPAAFAQAPFAKPLADSSRNAPSAVQAHPHGPGAAVHPGARGFVQRPVWRHVVRVAHRPTFHFRFHQSMFVVLGGPYFIQPTQYAYVSTPSYPATFYDPGDPSGGYNLFYCPSPAGYFPDVTDCPAGWWSTAPEEAPQADPGY